jgi:hypothetical protein
MKKKEVLLKRVEIHYICPLEGKEVQYTPKEWEFLAKAGHCDVCVEHGYISVNFKCRACGISHDLTIASW